MLLRADAIVSAKHLVKENENQYKRTKFRPSNQWRFTRMQHKTSQSWTQIKATSVGGLRFDVKTDKELKECRRRYNGSDAEVCGGWKE